jgi:hypothetical protein
LHQHEREDEREAVAITLARSYLCHFFGFLPHHW